MTTKVSYLVAGITILGVMALTPLSLAQAVSTGPIAKQARPEVACSNDSFTQVRFKVEPRRCMFLKKGGTAYYQGGVLEHGKWRGWGHRSTRARGKTFLSSNGPDRVTVTLRKLVPGCSGLVYSKVRIDPKHEPVRRFNLEICRR